MSDGKVIIDTELDDKGAEKGISNLSKTLGGLGKVGSVALKGTAVAIGAATTAVGGLVAASTKAYSSYEQLVGGVNTLFGAGDKSLEEYAQSVGKTTDEVKSKYDSLITAQSTVMDNASKAYDRAGLSMNQYMEQITGFSASLVQSLEGDTEKAAEYGNRAIIDMSDNANKMGTGIEMIQNAYQGFAKQNYTMLDNLKLGYGGTKTEMERLVKDASQMTDIQNKLNVSVDEGDLSFGNIVNAISVMQDSLGIAGTTAKEASTTIEGSANAMKASWENLVTGMGNEDANLEELITQFVDSVTTFAGNITPVIEQSLLGVSQLIEGLLPAIQEMIPSLIQDVLPELLEAGVRIVTSLAQGIIDSLPTLVPVALTIVNQLLDSIIPLLPLLIQVGLQVIVQLAQGIAEALPNLIPTLVDVMLEIVDILIDNVDLLVDASIAIMVGLAEGLIKALPKLITKVPQILEKLLIAFTTNAPKLVKAAVEMINILAKGLIESLPSLIKQIPQLLLLITEAVIGAAGTIAKAGYYIITGLWQGIKDNLSWLLDKVKSIGKSIVDTVKGSLGIHSPSKVMKDEVGNNIDLGIAEGISDNEKAVTNSVDNLGKKVLKTFKSVMSADAFKEQGKDLVNKLTDGINSKISKFKDSISDIEKTYQSAIDDIKKKQEELSSSLKGLGGDLYTKDESGKVVLSNINEQTAQVVKFGQNLNALKGRISEDLMNEILGMNAEEALQFTDALLQLGAEELQAYNDSYTAKLKASNDIAKAWYKDDLKTLEDEYTSKVNKKFKKLVNSVSKAGSDALKGFLKPFKDNKKVDSALNDFCNNVVKQIKSKFKIHSPSRVFMEIGEMNALGLAEGFVKTDPMKEISDNIDAGMKNIDTSLNNEMAVNSVIDYDKLAQANAEALQNANLGVTVNGRQFGRVVREVI